MAGNPDFNAILSTTLQNYQPTLVDNIFKDLVLLNHLNSRGRVVVEMGGTSIVEPLMYGVNSTVSSYSGYDPISLTPQDGISAAEYDWKQLAASIAISGIEEAKNRGTEAIIKLLNAKIMQAEESLKSELNSMLFSDGTGNSGKDFNGLENIVGTQNNTVGGIDSSTDAWWDPTQATTMGATLTLGNMGDVYNRASKGSDVPDLIITNTTLYEKYESLLTPNVRYQDVSKANAGFQNLMFKQTPVVFDLELAATGGATPSAAPMYFLNTKYLKLVGMEGRWFATTPFQQGTVAGKDARYALVMAFGELTCSNRSRQGYLTALG